MSDKNTGRPLTPEEAIAAERKKKVQSFKLQIDDFGFGDNYDPSAPQTPVHRPQREENVDDILKGIQETVNKRHFDGNESGSHAKRERSSSPPLYLEPDSDNTSDENNSGYGNGFLSLSQQDEAAQETELEILPGSEPSSAYGSPSEIDEEDFESDTLINSYSDEELKKKMNLEDEKSLKAYKKSVKKRCKKKARRNGCMFKLVWLVMVLFVSVLLGMFIIRGTNDMLAINRGALPSANAATDSNGNPTAGVVQKQNTVSVEIPANATLDQVTTILTDSGVIKEPLFFKLYASVTKSGEPFLEGSYQMETNMDYEAILNFLIYNSGPKNTVSVRFTEGMNARQIAKLLQEKGVCNMDKFLEACSSNDYDDDYEFIKNIENPKERYYKLEGYLFPDTYTFYVNDNVDNVITKFLDNFYNKVCVETKHYSGYADEMTIEEYAQLQGMSIDYLINVASLVQAEAADEHDMYNIASIFYNRLSTNATDGITPYGDYDVIRLKSDVTVYYPYLSKDDVPKDLKKTFESTYNTYKIKGLPPGAVCNAGEKAISAALSPSSTSYYFFCHKPATDTEPAVAYYATTYAEQVENEKKAGLRD